MIRAAVVVLALALVARPTTAAAQYPPSQDPPKPPTDSSSALRPAVGETWEYHVSVGPLRVGRAHLSTDSLIRAGGSPALAVSFAIRGGFMGFGLTDRYETWVDTAARFSFRYAADIRQTRYRRQRVFDINPHEGYYTENGGPRLPSAADPLDELSLILLLQTLDLEVGKSLTFDRYFRPDRNPVLLEVLKAGVVRTGLGSIDAVLVRLQVRTPSGFLGEDNDTEIWIATGGEPTVPKGAIVQISTRVAGVRLKMTLERMSRRS